MDETYTLVDPCPFCWGKVRITDYSESLYKITTKAECTRCGMEFTYAQDFVASKTARAACAPSFMELWNRPRNLEGGC